MSATPHPLLGRWLFASISKHFNDRRGSFYMYVEGQPRDATAPKDFFELRIDGPDYKELSKNYWSIYLEVNCLVQSACDDTNYQRIHDNCGKVAYMFDDILVYRYGEKDPTKPLYDPENDDSFIGCLKLEQSPGKTGEKLVTRNFGIIEQSTLLMQSCVEGHYSMEYTKQEG